MASAALCFILIQFLDEPSGHMAEVLENGSVKVVDVITSVKKADI